VKTVVGSEEEGGAEGIGAAVGWIAGAAWATGGRRASGRTQAGIWGYQSLALIITARKERGRASTPVPRCLGMRVLCCKTRSRGAGEEGSARGREGLQRWMGAVDGRRRPLAQPVERVNGAGCGVDPKRSRGGKAGSAPKAPDGTRRSDIQARPA
jgi:hypothetical protein